MTFHRPGARVCARTGLVLVPSAGEPAYRVAPEFQRAAEPAGARAGRFGRVLVVPVRHLRRADRVHHVHPGVRVRRGAGRVRRRLGARDSLAKDAAAVGLSVPEFLQAVDEDWAELGVMLPGHLPRAWRTARLLYTVTHPRSGWWMMLDTAESDRHGQGRAAGPPRRARCRRRRPGAAARHGTAGHVEIAGWVRSTIVDDGSGPHSSGPHGIVYRSRHAGGDLYAYWLRRLDTVHPAGTEPLAADTGTPITAQDSDLLATATRYGLTVH